MDESTEGSRFALCEDGVNGTEWFCIDGKDVEENFKRPWKKIADEFHELERKLKYSNDICERVTDKYSGLEKRCIAAGRILLDRDIQITKLEGRIKILREVMSKDQYEVAKELMEMDILTRDS
jgi:hypothetical protein